MKPNMKARILLVLTAVLITGMSVSYAQTPANVPIFQLGVKAGANITKIGNKSFEDEFKFGYHAGGFAIIKLSNVVQLQPEVLFNQFNTKTSNDFGTVGDPNNLKNVKLNYLTIPLLLNITPAKILSIQAGAQYGILINNGEDLVQNGKDAFKSGDFSALGGLQLNLASFKVGARYMIGLSDIGDLPNKEDWKNQGFQVYVGFRLL